MKPLRDSLIWMLICLPLVGMTQYNLEEVGVELGSGTTLLQSMGVPSIGPAANVNAFFSHYACGKGYGFHIRAGAVGMFPSTSDGQAFMELADAGRTSLQFMNLDVAVLGKLRIHEYHRPKEWAVFFGPRLQVPLMTRYKSELATGRLNTVTENVSRLWPGVELSVQFRRPLSKKTSWFIHPGAAYFFLPSFTTIYSHNETRPLYLFLSFGFQIWDQRG